jgi:hypothetical protein
VPYIPDNIVVEAFGHFVQFLYAQIADELEQGQPCFF